MWCVRCCCRYTNKGRAFNPFAPTIGDSLNTAFISAVYATIESTQISSNLQFRLNCWSRSQVRYVLGDAGRSLVSGWGHKAPTHVQVNACLSVWMLLFAVLEVCVVWYTFAFTPDSVNCSATGQGISLPKQGEHPWDCWRNARRLRSAVSQQHRTQPQNAAWRSGDSGKVHRHIDRRSDAE